MKHIPAHIAFVLFAAPVALGEVRYVKPNGSGTSDCRVSWSNACTLQRALTVAQAGDQLWVQRGTYVPGTSTSATFLVNKNLKIYGGFAGTETLLVQRPLDPDLFTVDSATDSILSGDLNGDDDITSQVQCVNDDTWLGVDGSGNLSFTGAVTWTGTRCLDEDGFTVRSDDDNALHVVTFLHTFDEQTILDGFTIMRGRGGNGAGIVLVDNDFDPPPATGARIFRCAVLQNRAPYGGQLGGGISTDGRLPPPNYLPGGGPIWIVDSLIAENDGNSGGGAWLHASEEARVVNTQIVNNRARFDGGGLAAVKITDPWLVNSLVAWNVAGPLTNARGRGGGVQVAGIQGLTGLLLADSTVAYNTVRGGSSGPNQTDGGGIFFAENSQGDIVNSIVWNNTTIIWNGVASTGRQIRDEGSGLVTVRYSNVQQTTAGDVDPDVTFAAGNLGTSASDNPLFNDPDGPDNTVYTYADNDFRLQALSRCIDAGDNVLVRNDATDLDGDTNTNEHTPLDLSRLRRFVNGPTTEAVQSAPDLEYPSPLIVDMGAYEFPSAACVTNADCADGDPYEETCVGGVCIECLVDVDCPGTTGCVACLNGRCVDNFRIAAQSNPPRRNRFLSFSVTHPEIVTGEPQQEYLFALKVTMLDLHHPVPSYNTPPTCPVPPVPGCSQPIPPVDVSAFDVDANAVCMNPSTPGRGYHCHGAADCRMCVSGPRLNQHCATDTSCGQCIADHYLVCAANADCQGTCNSAPSGACVNTICAAGPRIFRNCSTDADCNGCTNSPIEPCASDGDCYFGPCDTGTCSNTGSSCGTPTGCTEAQSNDVGGCARWVGKPRVYLEAQELPGFGNYRASRLQCTPYYHDWRGEGVVHVTGAEIMPSSDYVIQIVPQPGPAPEQASVCDPAYTGSTCPAASCAIYAQTGRSGDIAADFAPPATVGQPNAIDIVGTVNNFKKAVGAPKHAEAQVQPNLPNLNRDVDALDVGHVVAAYKLTPYPFEGPCRCPSLVTCDHACTKPEHCKLCVGGPNAGIWCDEDSDCDSNNPPAFRCTTVGLCTWACAAGGPRAGEQCTSNKHCGMCVGGTRPGIPCDANSQCDGGTCTTGTCGATGKCIGGTNDGGACTVGGNECTGQGALCSTGLCRDKCGRCCGYCVAGTNDGGPCADNTQCPGGACDTTGCP